MALAGDACPPGVQAPFTLSFETVAGGAPAHDDAHTRAPGYEPGARRSDERARGVEQEGVHDASSFQAS